MERLRIDKLLSNMGLGSRKEIKSYIKKGLVTVDDSVVADPGQIVELNQTVYLEDQLIQYRRFIYLMLNKPSGVLSATEDNHCQTVVDLVEKDYGFYKSFPVGRLDKDTEGLILLTNDGTLAHSITSPKKHIPKTYYLKVQGRLTAQDVKAVTEGIDLGDFISMPGNLEIITAEEVSTAHITIYEGKFHQIKRMMEALNKTVTYLKRLSIGPLQLDPKLKLSSYRELSDEELKKLIEATTK